MSGRHNSMMEDRSSFLRHYPSTPHLDSFTTSKAKVSSTASIHRPFNNHAMTGTSSNVNLMAHSYMPKSTFSTFGQQKKPVPPPKSSTLHHSNINNNIHGIDRSRYQDDPNPYKVSTIDEYRIKVNDPFTPNKSCASNRSTKMFSYYTQTTQEDNAVHIGGEGEDDETENVRESFGDLDINGEYEDDQVADYNASKVHRSATLKSTRSNGVASATDETRRTHHHSGSASASSTGTGDIETDGGFILPEPDYDGFRHHHRMGNNAGEDCEGARRRSSGGGSPSGIIMPGPISDSSCTGSEGYSSVSAATSSSCSGSDPDQYAVPNTGRTSSSPDEGSILEANDSGIETPTRITEKDRMKIEYALMGRKTSIFVADCLANLYCMKKSNFVSRPNSSLSNHHQSGNNSYSGHSSGDGEWVLKYTGVPVLLLDLGETKSRDKRRIQIVLAELGSGLALWKDVIDNLSSYKVMEGSHTFHSMHLSTDHTKIIGLSFDDEECAELFFQRVDKLTSDFANISLSGSKSKSKSKRDKGSSKLSIKTKFVKPKKSDISQPCCFNHISSLTSLDKKRFPSLQNFVVAGGAISGGGSSGKLPGMTGSNQTGTVGSSPTSHEDFSMPPLALADANGSDLHF